MKLKNILFLFAGSLTIHLSAYATSLSIGADYTLRGVSVEERDKTIRSNKYYDQRLQGYLITDLSQDVEATLRIQSISIWGLEGSTTPLRNRLHLLATNDPQKDFLLDDLLRCVSELNSDVQREVCVPLNSFLKQQNIF
jgi:hypothetical protein